MTLKGFFQRSYHFIERVKFYGWKVAYETFIDGLMPPEKKESTVNGTKYGLERVPIWCCW